MCKEEVCPEHEERSSSLVQEEPQPPQIKEERGEELLGRPEEEDGTTMALKIIKVWSYAPPGKNFITTDVQTLMLWSVDFSSDGHHKTIQVEYICVLKGDRRFISNNISPITNKYSRYYSRYRSFDKWEKYKNSKFGKVHTY